VGLTQPIWTFQNEGGKIPLLCRASYTGSSSPADENSATSSVIRDFNVSSEILTAVSVNITLLWEMTPCRFADINFSAQPAASIIKEGV
jgi:hypothetical protein